MEKLKGTKTTSLVPKKFRSVREKNDIHRRNKSTEPGPKVRCRSFSFSCLSSVSDFAQSRPLSDMAWLSIFRPESVKQALREKGEVEKEASKVCV